MTIPGTNDNMDSKEQSKVSNENEIQSSNLAIQRTDDIVISIMEVGFWEFIGEFKKDNFRKIIETLKTYGPLSFGELMQKTRFTTNQLNHTLLNMRTKGFVVQDKKKYHLTVPTIKIYERLYECSEMFTEPSWIVVNSNGENLD